MINAMSYKGYTASMVFDAEDKVIVGRVQDIDDIISFHGESVAEFESNFHAAIEDYLAASKALGSAPERPASGKADRHIVVSGKCSNAVLVSEEDGVAIQETLFLLSVPGMRESIKAGMAEPVDACATRLDE